MPREHRATDIRYVAPVVQLGDIVQTDNKPDTCGQTDWAALFEKMRVNRGIKEVANQNAGSHEAMFA